MNSARKRTAMCSNPKTWVILPAKICWFALLSKKLPESHTIPVANPPNQNADLAEILNGITAIRLYGTIIHQGRKMGRMALPLATIRMKTRVSMGQM